MGSTQGQKTLQKEWTQGEGLKKVCKWARHGLADKQIFANIGISATTYYKWLKDNPKFAEEIKQARIQPNIEIENSMFELACGRVYVEEIKSTIDAETGKVMRIEKTRKQVPPSPVLLIFLAKNRMKDRYKDYAPVPFEPDNADTQVEVQVYMPDNGRDKK